MDLYKERKLVKQGTFGLKFLRVNSAGIVRDVWSFCLLCGLRKKSIGENMLQATLVY